MCGIVGWVNWEHSVNGQAAFLERMMGTLAARGPDAQGQWISQHAAIGHRRLTIVDPEGGEQPMVREHRGRTCVISYNGELYNTPELRQELERRGCIFSTRSDTEALLYSYLEWGTACLEKLNGIFAFAIWDETHEELFLARDRIGVKPLFYSQGPAFYFSSELKALLAHQDIRPRVSEEGLAEVLMMGPAKTPGHGIFTDVHELRPGWAMKVSRAGGRPFRYWSLVSRVHREDLNTTAERIRELLRDTVERQLVSDVPVCTLLSGGLDSSAITVFAAQAFQNLGRGRLHTYSIDYVNNAQFFRTSDFQPNSDAPWANKVAKLVGSIHHSVVIDSPELTAALKNATLAKDLPGMADVDSSLYLFCREVKKGATVALSGECADEIFGGYPWFHQAEALTTPMFPWIRYLSERVALWNPSLFKSFSPEEYVRLRYEQTIAETPRLEGEEPLAGRRREIFYLNLLWFMTALLDRKDRMSMATGLEVRVPFADHRLVEYVWNIPWEMKTCDNMAKGILRRALSGLLPKDVLYRRKSPYPKTHNPAYADAVRSWLKAILADSSSPLHQVIHEPRIRQLTEAPSEVFDKPFFGQLMGTPQLMAYLIQVDTWLKEYKVQIV